jgi:hypothetical protein
MADVILRVLNASVRTVLNYYISFDVTNNACHPPDLCWKVVRALVQVTLEHEAVW